MKLKNKKTAVVYDKWFNTFGGGEVVVAHMVQALLNDNYDVTVVMGNIVNKEDAKKRFGVDFSKVKFVQVWNDRIALNKITKKVDVFINTTFMDYSPGFAKKNFYYVHFPTEIYGGVKDKVFKKYVYPYFLKNLGQTEIQTNDEYKTTINGKLVYLLDKHNLDVIFYELSPNSNYQINLFIFVEKFIKSDLENLKFNFKNATITEKKLEVDHKTNVLKLTFNIKTTKHNTVYLKISDLSSKKYNYSPKYLAHAYITPHFLPKVIKNKVSNFIQNKSRAGIFQNIIYNLNKYDLILANSKFTLEWVKNYWNQDGEVLYPPVRLIPNQKKIKKEKYITNVGRFFTLGHGKKQEVLIKAFKQFFNAIPNKEWQLHLIGGVSKNKKTLEYINFLKQLAEGYPVFFHFNISRKELEEILLKSQIYWHATGYKEKKPIKMEHFGIAVVEAISAQNIPFVYERGGMKEILNTTDFKENTFQSIDELVNKTAKYLDGSKKISWSKVRKNLESNFSARTFEDRFLKLIQTTSLNQPDKPL